MNHRFSEVDFEISADERKWLKAVYDLESDGEAFNPRALRINLRASLSLDFRPSSIDQRFYLSGRRPQESAGLTLIGTWLVDADAERVLAFESVVCAIRDLIMANPQKIEFFAPEVAEASEKHRPLSEGEVEIVFADLMQVGSFVSGATSIGQMEERRRFAAVKTDSERALIDYFQFDTISSYLQDLLERWKANGSRSALAQPSLRSVLPPGTQYVSEEQIKDLREADFGDFDASKLIRLCEELNVCYEESCFFAVAMLNRAIIDHVPPVFKCDSFNQVANNYGGGGKSFKEIAQHLNRMSRSIADTYLHQEMRMSEALPKQVQVNFSHGISMLLDEILHNLKANE